MAIAFTSGGSPIIRGPSTKKVKSKPLYKCSKDERHKLTTSQARSSGWWCTHCGAELRVRKDKISELNRLADELGFKVSL